MSSQENIIIGLFREFAGFLNSLGVAYWIDSGTLLGAIREKRIFPWDTDLDFGIWARDSAVLFERIFQLEGRGYKVRVQKSCPFAQSLVQVRLPEEVTRGSSLEHVDIYLWKRFRDEARLRWLERPRGAFAALRQKYISRFIQLDRFFDKRLAAQPYLAGPHRLNRLLFRLYCSGSLCEQHIVPAAHFSGLERTELYDIQVPVPSQPEAYLTLMYGEDWRQPKPDWNRYQPSRTIAPCLEAGPVNWYSRHRKRLEP